MRCDGDGSVCVCVCMCAVELAVVLLLWWRWCSHMFMGAWVSRADVRVPVAAVVVGSGVVVAVTCTVWCVCEPERVREFRCGVTVKRRRMWLWRRCVP